ncbi:MAG TPA: cyclic nucleotide-binding domain-containing protein [Hyphomicrobiaceae bacterium]|nr:cyclic nucleotide-binding domain-containing protein [Hyphomicrobiaceae bacterium]
MAIDALVRPFLALELFKGLTPLQITEIARRAERVVYKPGDVIMEKGAAGDAAIIVVGGTSVRTDGAMTADQCLPVPEGSLLGELAMLIEQTYGSTVVALTPVKALRITRTAMHEMMLDDTRLADHFVQRISSRLKSVAAELRRIDSVLAMPFAASIEQPTPA